MRTERARCLPSSGCASLIRRIASLIRADVADGAIAVLAVYCTGDCDQATQAEHAAAVTLLRP